MFLISATKNQIREKLNDVIYNVRYVETNSLFITILTDNFLSTYVELKNGFSVIESVIAKQPDAGDLILSEVIFDNTENKLSIYKPTHSGRPLYYHITSNGDFYCSTHISLLKKIGVVIEENQKAVPELLVFGYITPSMTLYKNIKSIPIGNRLNLKITDGRCILESEQQFNPFDASPEITADAEINDDITQKLFQCLHHALEQVMSQKHRLCFLLSGGLDSSILLKLAKDQFAINKSYSTAYPFEDPAHDLESKYATSAANAFHTAHTLYRATTKEYLQSILESIASAEEPIHHKQSAMFHLLFKHGIPQTENIIVSGEGADGIFGSNLNYNIMKWSKHKTMYRFISKYPFISAINALSKLTGAGQGILKRSIINRNIDRSLSDPENIIYYSGKYGNEDWTADYFNVSKSEIIESQYRSIARFHDRPINDIKAMSDFLCGVSLTQSIWSKIAEHNGKIFYCPYLTNKVTDFAYSINWQIKLMEPKHLLRDVARYLNIPDLIINRRKSGFGIDPRKWAYKGGILDPLIPLAAKCFDKKAILGIQSTEPHNAATFWNILNYAIWKRLCIDREPLETLAEELTQNISIRSKFNAS